MRKGLTLVWTLSLVCAFAAYAQTPQEVTVEKDVVYGHSDDVDLKLDLAKPPAPNGPVPAIVCIHGGGWAIGDKGEFEPHIRLLASCGYVAAAVEYRFAPKYKWPAQIEDVKCAVRYLRAHAKELNIDPGRIGALGHSAGGHLALLLGLMGPQDGFEGTGGNPEQPSTVRAVVNFSGLTDLHAWHAWPEAEADFQKTYGTNSEGVLADLLGTSDRTSPLVNQASPVTYINAGDPPILTFHGTKDPIVPYDQAKLLHEALDKALVPQTLVTIEGAGHGLEGDQLASAIAQTLGFLETSLKAAAPPATSVSAAMNVPGATQ